MTATIEDRTATDRIPAPIDLAVAPGLRDFLREHGLGELLAEDLGSPAGRNAVWIGRTSTGADIVVKKLLGEAADAALRLRRSTDFETLRSVVGDGPVPLAPRQIAVDPETSFVAFETVLGGRSLAAFVVDETSTVAHSRRLGEVMGTVHGSAEIAGSLLDLDRTPCAFPAVAPLHALPFDAVERFSFGEIQSWQLLQQDVELRGAVERLRSAEAAAPQVPAHCDFRLDQVLITDDDVWLVDWEEFRLADAARDVGDFVGEWLYRAVLDVVTTRGGQDPLAEGAPHEVIVARAVDNVLRLRPHVVGFWAGYRRIRTALDEGFVARATAFAGWHAIDRLLASSSRLSKLTAIERAAAGIGRRAMLAPDRFGPALGLEEEL